MALPTGVVYVSAQPAAFSQPEESLRLDPLRDFERAGVAVQDPDSGLDGRNWVCEKQSSGDVVIFPEDDSADTLVLLRDALITELSFCFDRAMNPTLAYITPAGGTLRWYDSSIPGFTTQAFAATGCYLVLDDKSPFGDAYADVLLLYLRGPVLYYRQQRDRFLVERTLHTFPGEELYIRRAARCENYRVQIEVYGPDAQLA